MAREKMWTSRGSRSRHLYFESLMTEQLYQRENYELVRTACDRMEEFLTTRGQGNRDRLAVELLEV
jgi:hypothetical protein